MMMEWMVVAMMMGGGCDESIDRPNDHHAVVGTHVDGVDGHVDDALDGDQDVEVAS